MSDKFDLQQRLIDYAVIVIEVSDKLPRSMAGRHIASQILRSGTAPAANYGEAQSAESRRDFVHKLKLSLKELRETEIWLKILSSASLFSGAKVDFLLKETDELISILYASVKTAEKNLNDNRQA